MIRLTADAELVEDEFGGVVARGTKNAAAGVGGGAGEVKVGGTVDAIGAEFGQGAEEKHLVKGHL